jgi:hypothetical protein
MNTSTLTYGVEFKLHYNFPWNMEIYKYDINEWLISKKLKPFSIIEIIDNNGYIVISLLETTFQTTEKIEIDGSLFEAIDPSKTEIFNFCKKHKLKYKGKPKWFLINHK